MSNLATNFVLWSILKMQVLVLGPIWTPRRMKGMIRCRPYIPMHGKTPATVEREEGPPAVEPYSVETSGGIGTTQACEGSERDFYWAKGEKQVEKEGTKSNTKGEGTKSITSSRRIWDLHQTCCGAWWSCIKGLEQLDFWYNERCLGKEAQTGGDFEKGTLRI